MTAAGWGSGLIIWRGLGGCQAYAALCKCIVHIHSTKDNSKPEANRRHQIKETVATMYFLEIIGSMGEISSVFYSYYFMSTISCLSYHN